MDAELGQVRLFVTVSKSNEIKIFEALQVERDISTLYDHGNVIETEVQLYFLSEATVYLS